MAGQFEVEIIGKAIQSFKKSFNISASFRQQIEQNADALIDINFSLDGKTYMRSYNVEVKRSGLSVRPVIGNLYLKQKQSDARTLLITEHIPPSIADKLRELDISFLDCTGNAYFNELPDFYIFINSRKKEGEIALPNPGLIFQASGMRLLFVLLSNPGAEAKTYRELADLSGISLGSVNEIMSNLLREFYLVEQKKERLLVRKNELVKRWVQTYPESLRPKLRNVRLRTSSQEWWKTVDLTKINALWGGEVAAGKITHYLVPAKFTLYTRNVLSTLRALTQMGLRRDPNGEVEVLERFWNFADSDQTVPDLLVYADLMATADARNLEVAQIIYDTYLTRYFE